jgi:hypothetical protein
MSNEYRDPTRPFWVALGIFNGIIFVVPSLYIAVMFTPDLIKSIIADWKTEAASEILIRENPANMAGSIKQFTVGGKLLTVRVVSDDIEPRFGEKRLGMERCITFDTPDSDGHYPERSITPDPLDSSGCPPKRPPVQPQGEFRACVTKVPNA